MPSLFQHLETTATRGAGGLTASARQTLIQALRALQQSDGGCAGLDGRSDPYFTLFAWLSLRALGIADDHAHINRYMTAHRSSDNAINKACARLLLTHEGQLSYTPLLPALIALGLTPPDKLYTAFVQILALRRFPRIVARLTWWHYKKGFQHETILRLPTSWLAAGLVLAFCANAYASTLVSSLLQRHASNGGFATVSHATPDLLATATARFALSLQQQVIPNEINVADIHFIEACWLEDGLFGASPTATQGDAEQTFYGLLALGTCRSN